jgi:hypothetical protein
MGLLWLYMRVCAESFMGQLMPFLVLSFLYRKWLGSTTHREGIYGLCLRAGIVISHLRTQTVSWLEMVRQHLSGALGSLESGRAWVGHCCCLCCWRTRPYSSLLAVREKERTRRENARESESSIAAQEVQSLLDDIGEPPSILPQGQVCPRQQSPRQRCILGLL